MTVLAEIAGMIDLPNDLSSFTDEQLENTLVEGGGLTAKILWNMGRAWSELKRRGRDMSEFYLGKFTDWIESVAAGTVVPELVVALIGCQRILRRVAELPPDEQRRIAKGGGIPVVEKRDGNYDTRMLPLSAIIIRNDIVKQVFGDRGLRTETAQKAYLMEVRPAPNIGRPVRRGKTLVDRRLGIVKIDNKTDTIENVIAALKAEGAI
jgi:hypothetical protein